MPYVTSNPDNPRDWNTDLDFINASTSALPGRWIAGGCYLYAPDTPLVVLLAAMESPEWAQAWVTALRDWHAQGEHGPLLPSWDDLQAQARNFIEAAPIEWRDDAP